MGRQLLQRQWKAKIVTLLKWLATTPTEMTATNHCEGKTNLTNNSFWHSAKRLQELKISKVIENIELSRLINWISMILSQPIRDSALNSSSGQFEDTFYCQNDNNKNQFSANYYECVMSIEKRRPFTHIQCHLFNKGMWSLILMRSNKVDDNIEHRNTMQ